MRGCQFQGLLAAVCDSNGVAECVQDQCESGGDGDFVIDNKNVCHPGFRTPAVQISYLELKLYRCCRENVSCSFNRSKREGQALMRVKHRPANVT